MSSISVTDLTSVGRDLDGVARLHEGHRSMRQPRGDDPLKQGAHLLRPGVGAQIPVADFPPQQKIAHAAPHRVGLETG